MEPFLERIRTRLSQFIWFDSMYQDISQVLSDFLTGFQRNPMDALETTELHKQLFSALHRQYADAGVKFELERSSVGMEFQPERKKIQINPVRTAYPPKEKFDIVVLDTTPNSEDKEKTEEEQDTYQVYWQQPLSFALNLHLCLEEEQVAKYLKAQAKDLRKMGSYQEQLPAGNHFTGITLLLVDVFLGDDPGPEINWDLSEGLHAWVVTPDTTYLYQP